MCSYLDSSWKINQNEYKQAYVWSSGSWDSLWYNSKTFFYWNKKGTKVHGKSNAWNARYVQLCPTNKLFVKKKPQRCLFVFIKAHHTNSRTTGPNIRLFVLILMQFRCRFQICPYYRTILNLLKIKEQNDKKMYNLHV